MVVHYVFDQGILETLYLRLYNIINEPVAQNLLT